MRILAAVFIDTIQLRQVPGPSTRIDLGGVKFSEPAPGPFPVTVEPHLVVLLHCPSDEKGEAALEVIFEGDIAEPVRNVQLATVDPGRFGYRLVRAELTFDAPGTVEASCRLDGGDAVVVPFTMLDPVGTGPG